MQPSSQLDVFRELLAEKNAKKGLRALRYLGQLSDVNAKPKKETKEQPPSTRLLLANSIRFRQVCPRPSRMGNSLGEPEDVSPVVAVNTTVTLFPKKRPAKPARANASPDSPPLPPRALARRSAQKAQAASPPAPAPALDAAATTLAPDEVTAEVAPTTSPLPPPTQKNEDGPAAPSESVAEPAPVDKTILEGEWMAIKMRGMSKIEVQEGKIFHKAVTPLRQALWTALVLDLANETGLSPKKLLRIAERLFLAVKVFRGTRLRTLRSWHAPYKTQQPGVASGSRRVWPLPSVQPAAQPCVEQAPQQAALPAKQPAVQPSPPTAPAPTTERVPLQPFNAVPRRHRRRRSVADVDIVNRTSSQMCRSRAQRSSLDHLSQASWVDVAPSGATRAHHPRTRASFPRDPTQTRRNS